MKLENQVSNRELSERIKELGVPQESLWYWEEDYYRSGGWTGDWSLRPIDKSELKARKEKLINNPDKFSKGDLEKIDGHSYSAFTVAELGEILPAKYWPIRNLESNYWEPVSTAGMKWSLVTKLFEFFGEDDMNEADARAKMLIYLLENKLMEGGKK